MELKLPFKLRIKYLNANEGGFQGKAIFHDIEYAINIHAQANEKIIKVPFAVMGVTDSEILVRVSGPFTKLDAILPTDAAEKSFVLAL